jgi:uncharacterized membrane-anchored protein
MKAKDIFQYALAALIVIVVVILIYVVFKTSLPPENKDIALMVIGAIVMKFGDVVGYFFNSSKGSAEKTDIIARSQPINTEIK